MRLSLSQDSRSLPRCLVALPLLWISACAVVNGDAPTGPEAQCDTAVTGKTWKLSRFDASEGDESFSVPASERYTLALQTDGSYRVKADCNRMQGAYRLEDERISISPGAATLAECGPDSHYAQYLRLLIEARQFEVIDKAGQLKLITGKGQLIFVHAEHESP